GGAAVSAAKADAGAVWRALTAGGSGARVDAAGGADGGRSVVCDPRRTRSMNDAPYAPPTAPTPVASADAGGTGLAVAALVCGIVGLCVPVLGLVAIILGVVYLARPRTTGRGLAIGGIVTGVLGLLSTVALLLPALGQA
ncbi:MAG: DUF4190 domain-containing protein, partial [Phycisphaerales bacterium]